MFKIIKNPGNTAPFLTERAIKDNDGYCPCVLDKTDDTKCMCKEFRDQNYTGICHCGLYCKIPNVKYVAVDFDGTIVEYKFPDIGKPNIPLINKIRLMHECGIKIILHTCRENGEVNSYGVIRNYLDEALWWCHKNDVPIDFVNENPLVSLGERKIYADLYIDDKALNVNDVEKL